MAHPQIAAFARLANGNAQPTRAIAGQNSLITRTIHMLDYNPIRDEIVVPQFYAQAVMTFRGAADGDEAPIRIIHGRDTQLNNPDGLAVDAVHGEIFVPVVGKEAQVLVFAVEANGNVAPIRVLKGPDTLLTNKANPHAVGVDPIHDVFVIGSDKGLLIFNRTDSGNVKPRAVIGGPKTQLRNLEEMVVYPAAALILAGINRDGQAEGSDFVGVWSIQDNGDMPPRWTIGGPGGLLREVSAVTLDPKNKSVIISDKKLNSVLTYYFPEIF